MSGPVSAIPPLAKLLGAPGLLPFDVDVWQLPLPPLTFLTHAHNDHLVNFEAACRAHARAGGRGGVRVWCTATTKEIVKVRFPEAAALVDWTCVEERRRRVLDGVPGMPPGCPEGWAVTPLPANHCPGAVMFLFSTPAGTILHTGDVRWSREVVDAALAALADAGRARGGGGGALPLPLPLDLLVCDASHAPWPYSEIQTPEQAAGRAVQLIHAAPPGAKWTLSCMQLGSELLIERVCRAFGEKVYVPPPCPPLSGRDDDADEAPPARGSVLPLLGEASAARAAGRAAEQQQQQQQRRRAPANSSRSNPLESLLDDDFDPEGGGGGGGGSGSGGGVSGSSGGYDGRGGRSGRSYGLPVQRKWCLCGCRWEKAHRRRCAELALLLPADLVTDDPNSRFWAFGSRFAGGGGGGGQQGAAPELRALMPGYDLAVPAAQQQYRQAVIDATQLLEAHARRGGAGAGAGQQQLPPLPPPPTLCGPSVAALACEPFMYVDRQSELPLVPAPAVWHDGFVHFVFYARHSPMPELAAAVDALKPQGCTIHSNPSVLSGPLSDAGLAAFLNGGNVCRELAAQLRARWAAGRALPPSLKRPLLLGGAAAAAAGAGAAAATTGSDGRAAAGADDNDVNASAGAGKPMAAGSSGSGSSARVTAAEAAAAAALKRARCEAPAVGGSTQPPAAGVVARATEVDGSHASPPPPPPPLAPPSSLAQAEPAPPEQPPASQSGGAARDDDTASAVGGAFSSDSVGGSSGGNVAAAAAAAVADPALPPPLLREILAPWVALPLGEVLRGFGGADAALATMSSAPRPGWAAAAAAQHQHQQRQRQRLQL